MALQNPFPKFLTNIFQHIWFVWTVSVFLVTGLVALLAYIIIFNFFSRERAYVATFYVTKMWGKSILLLALIRVKTSGAEKLLQNGKDSQAYILVSNHQSAMDIPFCMSTCPVPFSFLAKAEVDRVPIVGYLARNMHVYVDRKSEQSRQESFSRMQKHIEAGRSIHIYVEGTRNRTKELLTKFHDGAFRLAIETQKPMAVLTLDGAAAVFNPRKAFRASPGVVHCTWNEPISTVGMTLEDMPRLKAMVRQRMLENLGEVEATDFA
jgi:1-acyl-sn-glycerol-3-phosphate acyltransferase